MCTVHTYMYWLMALYIVLVGYALGEWGRSFHILLTATHSLSIRVHPSSNVVFISRSYSLTRCCVRSLLLPLSLSLPLSSVLFFVRSIRLAHIQSTNKSGISVLIARKWQQQQVSKSHTHSQCWKYAGVEGKWKNNTYRIIILFFVSEKLHCWVYLYGQISAVTTTHP